MTSTSQGDVPIDRPRVHDVRSPGYVSQRVPAQVIALAGVLALALIPVGAEGIVSTRVFINGTPVPVTFNDGDSFRVQDGTYRGSQCRLAGFNTLESFGPAHQWGDWHPYELYINAKMATINGRRGKGSVCCFGLGQHTVVVTTPNCPNLSRTTTCN